MSHELQLVLDISLFWLIGAIEYQHVGCYSSQDILKSLQFREDKLLTPRRCLTKCSQELQSYLILKRGTLCSCINNLSYYLDSYDDALCSSPCGGNKLTSCGGMSTYDVYEVSYCNRLIQPKNGHVHQTMMQAWFWCASGYRLNGTDEIFCNKSNMRWTGSTEPLCVESSNPKDPYISWTHNHFVTIGLICGIAVLLVGCSIITSRYISLQKSITFVRDNMRRVSTKRHRNNKFHNDVDNSMPSGDGYDGLRSDDYYN